MQDAYGCRFGHLESEEQEAAVRKGAGGTFFLRLLLSILIFGGFFWMQTEKKTIFGYCPDQVAEAVCQNTDLQAISKSVRIDTEER